MILKRFPILLLASVVFFGCEPAKPPEQTGPVVNKKAKDAQKGNQAKPTEPP